MYMYVSMYVCICMFSKCTFASCLCMQLTTYSNRYTHSSSNSLFLKASSRFFVTLLTAVPGTLDALNPGVLKNMQKKARELSVRSYLYYTGLLSLMVFWRSFSKERQFSHFHISIQIQLSSGFTYLIILPLIKFTQK